MDVRNYFFLGLIHLPPVTSEIIIQATAAHEKAVLCAPMPIARKIIPRTRKIVDTLRRFIFIIVSLKQLRRGGMIIDLCRTVKITPKGCHIFSTELCRPFGI